MATKNTKRPSVRKPIALALQGGGMHGAFAWGVLDRLLEDGRLEIEGVSATSAGAMNAAVLAYGLLKGDSDGARQALHDFVRFLRCAFSPTTRFAVAAQSSSSSSRATASSGTHFSYVKALPFA
jgi:predicted acylesterase/phospholipase RssA